MNIPDYISPILGYRVWQWDDAGLRSVNGEPWVAGKPTAAHCRILSPEGIRLAHEAPVQTCTCGVYATKSLGHLRRMGYQQWGITGEVWLWGTVVEHTGGWRAQYAYPKAFFLGSDDLPFAVAAIQSRLEALTTYKCDILVASPASNLLLWTRACGYQEAGLDYVVEAAQNRYERRRRKLSVGDRIAVLGRGIAVVRMVRFGQVCAVFPNQRFVEIRQREIVWDEGNMRWEADYKGASSPAQSDVSTPGGMRSV